MKKAAKAEKKVDKPGWVVVEPIVGPPVAPGTTVPGLPVKGMRNTHAAVASLYVLEEIKLAIGDKLRGLDIGGAYRFGAWYLYGLLPAGPLTGPELELSILADTEPECAGFIAVALPMIQDYADTLARNMFDYLTIACLEEMTLGPVDWHDCSGHNDEDYPGSKPKNCWTQSKHADPRQALPAMAIVFRTSQWRSGFGGEPWARIADAASLYFSLPAAVFVDHCVDLSHHGGLVFSKGYIMSNPADKQHYKYMLDRKHAGSFLYGPASYKEHVRYDALKLLDSAVKLGIMPKPETNFTSVEDPSVETVKWGNNELHISPLVGYTGPADVTKVVPPILEELPKPRDRTVVESTGI